MGQSLLPAFQKVQLLASALAAVVLTASCASQNPGATTAAPAKQASQNSIADFDRPNILLIAIDDLRPDIGSYGHPSAYTPNIDSFASESILFERAYTQQAVCAPSRAALMTGLRPGTTGITDLKKPLDEYAPDAVSLADFFKAQGYETLSIGKIYHHKDDDANGWTQDPFNVVYDVRKERRNTEDLHLSHKREDDKDFLPDLQNADFAVSELERLSKSDRPFFMAYGIHKPHLPFFAPSEAWDRYSDEDVPEPVSRERQQGAPDYAVVAYEIWNYDDTPDSPNGQEIIMPEPLADDLRKGYLAAVTYADSVVGQILTAVDELDLEDDTIVIIWGDHGFKLGDYNAWAKHSNLEMDIHIPLILRVPGATDSGQRTTALVETVDVYPTLVDLAGFEVSSDLEGLSMVPLISDPDRDWKIAAFAQYDRGGERNPTEGRTVRTADFRYTAWSKGGKLVAQELYDHRTDPDELINVAGEPEYRDILELHEKLRLAGPDAVREDVKLAK